MTLRVVRELLSVRVMRAGQLDDLGTRFAESPLDVDGVIAEIESQWNRLGRDPNLGELFWFDRVD